MRLESRDSYREARDRLDVLARRESPGRLRAVADGLFAAAAFLDSHGGVRRALADPSASEGARRTLVTGLFGGRIDDHATELLAEMSRSRWAAPSDVGDAVEALGLEAALASAEAEERLDTVQEELFRYERLVSANPRLRVALADATVPTARKVDLLGSLFGERVDPSTLRLVTQVTTYPRGRTIESGLAYVDAFIARRRERLLALVESAVPLTEEQEERLADLLRRRLDHAVYLQMEVNPRVVGGFKVTVGDQIIDGTVAGRLTAARRVMTG